ncbi:MAG: PQQ-like beta-propeller repeat protein [Verrucomicrobia bacterium]|nr:PQQ-like beta-propeller repeat protein [Verrucomicrobiota bacterium]MBI3868777.1 PQQ-like beta-propeller repeat protein [Verrucomicrobiota bacterium]
MQKLSLLLLLLITGRIVAADWPQWRGPNRDGAWTESGVLSSFPPAGLIPRWTAPVGYGYSSPIITNGMLYLTDLVVEKPVLHERTLCFNARSGKRIWVTEHDFSAPDWFFVPAQTRGPGSTPLFHNGRVYGLSMFSTLKCLDARTGSVLWKRDLVAEYELPPSSLDASPLVDNGLLILSIGGKPAAGVVALDLLTGREVWRALSESASWSSPVIVSAGGTRQLIVWMRQSVTSLNPTNGAVYWREPTVSGGSPGFSAVSTPVVQGDRLLVSGLMFQLDRTRPAARVLWPDTPSGTRRILSDTSTPLFQNDFIYSPRSGGLFVCLEAGTGRELWQTNTVTSLRQGACVHFTPNGSSLFLFTDQGDLIRARLTPAGYSELGRSHLIDPTSPLFDNSFAWAAPAFANRNIFVRNDRELRCYSLAGKPELPKREGRR